jgi:hypothetical protein
MPISINLPAAQTAYLHAAKHADCAVFGLLIGSKDGSLEQAVPVCHLNVGCSPIVEAACVVVESMCKSDGLRIVGCYYAPMGIAEVVDFKEQKHRVLQSLAAAVLPAQGFTVCLVFSNADSGRALSVTQDCCKHLPATLYRMNFFWSFYGLCVLTLVAVVRLPPPLPGMVARGRLFRVPLEASR